MADEVVLSFTSHFTFSRARADEEDSGVGAHLTHHSSTTAPSRNSPLLPIGPSSEEGPEAAQRKKATRMSA